MQQRVWWVVLGVGAALAVALVVISLVLSSGTTTSGPVPVTDVTSPDRHKVGPHPTPSEPAELPGTEGGTGRDFLFKDGTSYTAEYENQGLVDCLREMCNALPGKPQLDMCRRRSCKFNAGSLQIAAPVATYSGGKLHVEATVSGDPGTYGDSHTADPVYLGLTVHTRAGSEVDFDAHEVPLSQLSAQQVFDGEVAGADGFVIGAWAWKQVPCPGFVSRDGCQKFGYSLEHRAGSYPANAYGGDVMHWQPL